MSHTRSKYTSEVLARPGLTFDTEIRDPKQRIQAYMDSYKQNPPSKSIDESLLRDHLELVDASASPQISASFRMRVSPEYCSRTGNMHGGLISLVFDLCTTMCAAPAARSDFWTFGGVSRTLNVTFLRSVRQGSWVRIHCELLHIGSRLSAIRGQMTNESDGRLLAVVEHNKASVALGGKKQYVKVELALVW